MRVSKIDEPWMSDDLAMPLHSYFQMANITVKYLWAADQGWVSVFLVALYPSWVS